MIGLEWTHAGASAAIATLDGIAVVTSFRTVSP
jgi:hypothetical protein